MANEYGEIEQLVGDVTSLDTARMTLRWALERLNSIEKEKAELKKNLAIAEETSKTLQVKEATLRDSVESRNKTLDEREDFYTKLEATMSLLGEGKLDIQQLIKKEAKLETLRKRLEDEYQQKFEELDHNQRSVIERWNSRLLETESQYAVRLADSQRKYDALRAALEQDYQGRLTSLQVSFKAREVELNGRIVELEKTAGDREIRTESRRAELESQYTLKHRELEDNYRKLKSMLQESLDDRLRAMDSDHAAQLSSLETSWQAERARLLEEQRIRDDQFRLAQDKLKEVENALASQQEAHHNELLAIITEKETAFRSQLEILEKEKTESERKVQELVARLEKNAGTWETERGALQAEHGERLARAEAALRERAAGLEKDFAAKKEELAAALAAGRGEFEKEFKARLEVERAALEGEKERLYRERELREKALEGASLKVKELEASLSASLLSHQAEIMERVGASEAAFRDKLTAFEAEKDGYNAAIGRLTDQLRGRDALLVEEKNKLSEEFLAKVKIYDERISKMEESFVEERAAYEARLSALADRMNKAAEAALLEKEGLKTEITRISSETQAMIEKRAAVLRADFDTRKVELEKEFVARYGDRIRAMEAEKDRMNEALAEREEQLKASFAREAAADTQLAELRKAATDEKNALALEYDRKLRDALKAAGEEASITEKGLRGELNALKGELSDREQAAAAAAEELSRRMTLAIEEAGRQGEARAAAVKADYERRLADAAGMAESRAQELKARIAGLQARMQEAAAERAAAEKALKEAFESEKLEWAAQKESLAAELDCRLAKAEETFTERVSVIRADYENRKASVENEYSARYADRVKALEAEKARMSEALAEREASLKDAYAKAGELDEKLAALRRETADSRNALAAEYDSKLREAMEGASREAAGREESLNGVIAGLREEIISREREAAAEKEKLSAELLKAVEIASQKGDERAASVRAHYEARLAEMEESAGSRIAELRGALASREAEQAQAATARLASEQALKEEHLADKSVMQKEFELRLLQAEAGFQDRVAGVRADYESRKAVLEGEFAARYADRVKALEAEKARMSEALAEREASLKDAYAKAGELDGKLAALRRETADSRNALAAEYDSKLREAMEEAQRALAGNEARLRAAAAEKFAATEALKDSFSAEKAALQNDFELRLSRAESSFVERISLIRAEYEDRKAALENDFSARYADRVKALEAEKARISEALADREASLQNAYAKAGAMEAELAARSAAMEEDFTSRKRRLEADLSSRAEAADKDAAAKIDYERRAWHAERARYENLASEAVANFSKSQSEIEELNGRLREAMEANAAREARFNKDLMEAKANYERELAFRVTDAVSVQTAHLLESLEDAKTKVRDLEINLAERESAIGALRQAAEAAKLEFESRLSAGDSEKLEVRRAELERAYAQRAARLEERAAELKKAMEADFNSSKAELAESFAKRCEHLAKENASLKEDMAKLRASEQEANERSTEALQKTIEAEQRVLAERLDMQRAHSVELAKAAAEAAAGANVLLEQKLRAAQEELESARKEAREAAQAHERSAAAEKSRLAEELARRDRYVESADMKVSEMELEIMKLRQNSSGDLVRQMAEQDAKFRVLVADEKRRREVREKELEAEASRQRAAYEEKIARLTEMLSAKERLMADEDRMYRQKQLELDQQHSDFNRRVNELNEDLFAQKQALAAKEKSLNEHVLELENEYASKAAEIVKMKAELNRAILEYKNRK